MAMGMAMCLGDAQRPSARRTPLPSSTTPELQHIFAEWLKGLEVKAERPGAVSDGVGTGAPRIGKGAAAMVAQANGEVSRRVRMSCFSRSSSRSRR